MSIEVCLNCSLFECNEDDPECAFVQITKASKKPRNEAHAQCVSRYYREHREERLEYSRQYYLKHRERKLAASNERNKAIRESRLGIDDLVAT